MKTSLFYRKLVHYFDLQHQLDDFDVIHESIVKDVVFKGTNLWILVFAIIIASVGLNMNSTAVIIGAMLISPLMGPINGMGYSLATYNFDLFRKSIKNFSFAVLAGLVASTMYFIVSPISTAHSELLARTSPTIYDVLIAFFGGMAGIVAISSRLKGNVIPGVAIATALMPPLCTAGYGLATGQMSFFFGAIFLFTINTVFIAISSVVVSQLLKFPIRTNLPAKEKKRINRIISFVISLILLPSIYFGYLLVQKENFNDRANRYVSNVNYIEGNYLLDSKIDNDKKIITLIYGGLPMKDEQRNEIVKKSLDFKLKGSTIDIKQGINIGELDKKTSEIMLMKDELNKISLQLKEKEKQLDSINDTKRLGRTLLKEIKAIYPQILSCGFAETSAYDSKSDVFDDKKIIIFGLRTSNLNSSEKKKIEDWLSTRLESDNISVYYERAD